MQLPERHVWLVHAAGAPQLPLLSHVWTPLPWHCVEPGVHTPVQAPLEQAWLVHGCGVPQWPDESHVCTPLPEHCVAPGVQVPEH